MPLGVMSKWRDRPTADLGATRSEGRLRAHCGSAKILLRALAARQMPQVRHSQCCYAAVKPVIYASRSELGKINVRVMGKVAVRLFT